MKRGYIQVVSKKVHNTNILVGKFYGHVDNPNTGKCVMRIEGDKKILLIRRRRNGILITGIIGAIVVTVTSVVETGTIHWKRYFDYW